jgi:hypothetical protein
MKIILNKKIFIEINKNYYQKYKFIFKNIEQMALFYKNYLNKDLNRQFYYHFLQNTEVYLNQELYHEGKIGIPIILHEEELIYLTKKRKE